MDEPFDFDTAETFRPDRSKEDWPASMADADKLWNKRITYDLINEILGYSLDAKKAEKQKGKKTEPPSLPARRREKKPPHWPPNRTNPKI